MISSALFAVNQFTGFVLMLMMVLFIDTAHEFSFIGFGTDAEEKGFLRDMDAAVSELASKVNGRYPIINDIHLAFPQDTNNSEE